ncbi:hypothetical protein AB0M47_04335 [Hamadaea sp. NPDC051192]|uniref:hypothetical protein n=1 Tax=Hamadaea sp. NPDC051192 TaxID=3154940 RepID=UPI003444C7A7
MLNRRQLGKSVAGLALGIGVGAAGVGRAAADPAGYDYTARETFDLFDTVFHSSGAVGQPTDTNEHGGLAWGQSYVLAGFLRMYQTYRDPYYLDRFIANVDLVLGNRDSERRVADYRGLSLPAWRATNPYTVGAVTLADELGVPLLEIRSALSYADDAVAIVRAGSLTGHFTLEVRNNRTARTAVFADLSTDPASPNYAVARIAAAYPTPTMVTAAALSGAPGALPAYGTFPLVSQPVVFTVHTGMITYPMASFARIVAQSPTLRSDPRYRSKADEYLQAAIAAARVHDDEWRQDETGRGYFVWPKGMPLAFDGTEQPTNQSLALGQTYVELAVVTGDPFWAGRARRLAAMFSADLRLLPNDSYSWPYWPTFSKVYNGFTKAEGLSEYTPSYGTPGNGATQIEDLSHGAIDVEFAVAAFRARLAFKGADMARFAHAYSRNMATYAASGGATTFLRVDGTGGLATSGQFLQAPRWMPAAAWDRAVFDHSRAVYDLNAVQPQSGSLLLCVAYLNWFAGRAE